MNGNSLALLAAEGSYIQSVVAWLDADRTAKIVAIATVLGGLSIWLMLPRGVRRGRRTGAVLGIIALALFASQLPGIGPLPEQALFFVLAGVTVISAAATITFRNPVYSAIWFALTLLGTAGLFLAQGAQFLGVATIVVYAGAILVTFLFVLMLANPAGAAYYDRLSWQPFWSATAGALLVGLLTLVLALDVRKSPLDAEVRAALTDPSAASTKLKPADIRAVRLLATPEGDRLQLGLADGTPLPDDAARFALTTLLSAKAPALEGADFELVFNTDDVLSGEHMAHLGGQLFTRHLIAIEVVGTLLLVALVGAVAIVMGGPRGVPSRPESARGA
jgi:NADH-quinone oxidoreductase subunit J